MTKIKFKEGNNWVDIGLEYYPIGAIYQSTSNTSPSSLFGGTWTEITDKFLLAAGTTYAAASTGGAATVTLTSAQSGMPAHSHGTTITQPAFSTPKFTHDITQPVFKYTAPASHTHSLSSAGWAQITLNGYGHIMNNDVKATSWTHNYKVQSGGSGGSGQESHAYATALSGKTDSGSCSGTANGTTASRTTNVAISDHAATACSRTTNVAVTVNNNTASNASSAHENMPPYLAVYTWQRVA